MGLHKFGFPKLDFLEEFALGFRAESVSFFENLGIWTHEFGSRSWVSYAELLLVQMFKTDAQRSGFSQMWVNRSICNRPGFDRVFSTRATWRVRCCIRTSCTQIQAHRFVLCPVDTSIVLMFSWGRERTTDAWFKHWNARAVYQFIFFACAFLSLYLRSGLNIGLNEHFVVRCMLISVDESL